MAHVEAIAWRDIGHGIEIAEFTEPGHDGPAGLLWRHGCTADPRGPESGGDSVPFSPPWPDGWTVEQREPLTISPSVLCRACGRHGFIRGGRWCPA